MAPNGEAEVRARVKEASRENRLSFRNRAEQLLRRELKEEAKEKCSSVSAAKVGWEKQPAGFVILHDLWFLDWLHVPLLFNVYISKPSDQDNILLPN